MKAISTGIKPFLIVHMTLITAILCKTKHAVKHDNILIQKRKIIKSQTKNIYCEGDSKIAE